MGHLTHEKLKESKMLILDNLKLKYKLFFVYLFCVFCPILIINLIFYHHMVGNVKAIQQNYYRQAAQRIISRIESDLGTVTALCNRISLDRILYEMLDREFPAEIEYVETYYNYFLDYIFINGESYPQINKAVFYTDNDTILHSGSVFIPLWPGVPVYDGDRSGDFGMENTQIGDSTFCRKCLPARD